MAVKRVPRIARGDPSKDWRKATKGLCSFFELLSMWRFPEDPDTF